MQYYDEKRTVNPPHPFFLLCHLWCQEFLVVSVWIAEFLVLLHTKFVVMSCFIFLPSGISTYSGWVRVLLDMCGPNHVSVMS